MKLSFPRSTVIDVQMTQLKDIVQHRDWEEQLNYVLSMADRLSIGIL